MIAKASQVLADKASGRFVFDIPDSRAVRFISTETIPTEGHRMKIALFQPALLTVFLTCLFSGRELWSQTFPNAPLSSTAWLHIRASDDWLAYNAAHDVLLAGKQGQIHALEANTGRSLWNQKSGGPQPLIVADDWFLNQTGMKFDLSSGEVLSEQPLFRRGGGCNYAVATRNLVFVRLRCATYTDLEQGTQHSLRNLRSGCSNNLVAAGGLLNVPCYSVGCVCNYPLQTSFSMFRLPESAAWEPADPLVLKRP